MGNRPFPPRVRPNAELVPGRRNGVGDHLHPRLACRQHLQCMRPERPNVSEGTRGGLGVEPRMVSTINVDKNSFCLIGKKTLVVNNL